MDIITIENDGPDIVRTDYWTTQHAMRGAFYVSINAGTFRILVPDVMIDHTAEWRFAREVIISRGPWPDAGKHDALEIMFEDDSDAPYAIHIGSEQVDRMPRAADRDRPGQPPRWRCAAWTTAGKILDLPCRYRIVKRIPWMRPF